MYKRTMRGVYIQKPLEFRLEISIECGVQGSPVPCALTVRNHGSESVLLSEMQLSLALGNLKKVKVKDEDAFQVLTSAPLDRASTVVPGGVATFSWDLVLEKNAPISDKAQTLYLLYGNSASAPLLGQLPLTVTMHPHYRAIFDTCETVFSFINKGESWKNGYTAVKYKAPDLRKFSLVDEISIGVRSVDGEELELAYDFKIKKLDATAHSLNFKKGKAEVIQSWKSSDYLFGGGFIRQEFLERSLEEAFAVVATGF